MMLKSIEKLVKAGGKLATIKAKQNIKQL